MHATCIGFGIRLGTAVWKAARSEHGGPRRYFCAAGFIAVAADGNGGMGSFYRSQHELIFVFKAGTGSHINNVELGRHGRYGTNVWTYAGVNTFSATRDDDLAMHPMVKPVAMVADAILDCSKRVRHQHL